MSIVIVIVCFMIDQIQKTGKTISAFFRIKIRMKINACILYSNTDPLPGQTVLSGII